jgi:hypothetical protein
MEGAHQEVHRDHSAQRQCLFRRRAENILRPGADQSREQRHGGESRRGRETQPMGCADADCTPDFRTDYAASASARMDFAHASSPAASINRATS